ncbi:LSM8 homolog, U6 small nuclear RNA associated isoform X5 [Bos mutus]|uniref:LSM8 homolog, U6 small nuclear RNA associated isoform X5 n=1 Tax=Bos mutus TaxID=72004 RepID=UPI0038B61BAC
MTSALENYINRTVAVITSDGRMIVGTLKGFDQTINLILDESHERVFSSSQGVEQVVLGLYIVRGDNVESKARSSMKKFEDREDMKYSRKVSGGPKSRRISRG